MERAFVYCRVSTDEQAGDRHYSLDYQEELCKEYAQRKGWTVLKTCKERASGRGTEDRPGFRELLADVESGVVDGVIVFRLDRLSRNVRDIYDFIERTRANDVDFVATSEAFDTSTAMGKAMLGVVAVFAQLTREMIGENSREGLARRARQGRYNGPKDPGPYGYDYSDGHLVVNEAEATTVRRIFELYTQQGWGLMKIASHLNQAGVPTKHNKQWTQVPVRQVLGSPLYVGLIRHKGEDYKGEHQPIVDQEVFDRAQAQIARRTTVPPHSYQSQHLLSGIARCGICNRRLRAHWVCSKRKGGGTYKHRLYIQRPNVHVGEEHCPGVAKSATQLEAVVLRKVREVAESPEFQEAAFEEAGRQIARNLPDVQKERKAFEQRLAQLDHAFDRWAERLDAGKVSEAQFDRRNEQLRRDQADLRARLAELQAREAEAEAVEVNLDQVRATLKDFDRVWDDMTIDEQRELLRNLVEHLKVWKDRGELKLVFFPPMEIPVVFKRGPAPKGSKEQTLASSR